MATLPKRGHQLDRLPSTFSIPTAPPRPAPVVVMRSPTPPALRDYKTEHTPYKASARRTTSTPAPRRDALQALYSAPQPNIREGRTGLGFVVADEAWLPGMFGTIRLLCAPDNVDMGRLELGVLSFAADHNPDRPIGRVTAMSIASKVVYGSAEISESPFAQQILGEIREGSRLGISPGFLIAETEIEDRGSGPDDFRVSVTQWEPFEISSTAIPRNSRARISTIQRGLSMNSDINAPQLVSTDDMIGLSLQAARVAIRTRQGTDAQRARLGRMLSTFETSLSAGASRQQAAADARDSLTQPGLKSQP